MLKFSSNQEKRRQKFAQDLMTIYFYKSLTPILMKFNPIKLRHYLIQLTTKHSKHSYTKTRNICILTGRSRSVYRLFRLSRMKIREYANAGYFTGVTKASW